jgi:cytochrome c1
MNDPTQSDQHEPEGGFYTPVGSRRSFFQWVTGGIAGIIGLGLAVPFRDPKSVSPGSFMPKFPLTDPELNDLTNYVLTLKSGT